MCRDRCSRLIKVNLTFRAKALKVTLSELVEYTPEGSMEYFICTVLGVLGYLGAHFALKPIMVLLATREAIAKALVLFRNVDAVSAPGDARIAKAKAKYHDLATTLIAQANSIPHYAVYSSLHLIPPFEDMREVHANLMSLSDAVGVQAEREDNRRLQQHIETALRLKI